MLDGNLAKGLCDQHRQPRKPPRIVEQAFAINKYLTSNAIEMTTKDIMINELVILLDSAMLKIFLRQP